MQDLYRYIIIKSILPHVLYVLGGEQKGVPLYNNKSTIRRYGQNQGDIRGGLSISPERIDYY